MDDTNIVFLWLLALSIIVMAAVIGTPLAMAAAIVYALGVVSYTIVETGDVPPDEEELKRRNEEAIAIARKKFEELK